MYERTCRMVCFQSACVALQTYRDKVRSLFDGVLGRCHEVAVDFAAVLGKERQVFAGFGVGIGGAVVHEHELVLACAVQCECYALWRSAY